MTVKDIMTKAVVTVKPQTSVFEVAKLMFSKDFSGVPVVDKQKHVVGIITEYDFLTRQEHLHIPSYIKLLSKFRATKDKDESLKEEVSRIRKLQAADLMTEAVVTVRPETTVSEAAEIFSKKHINPLPVLNKSGKLVGIVSRADIVKLLAKGL